MDHVQGMCVVLLQCYRIPSRNTGICCNGLCLMLHDTAAHAYSCRLMVFKDLQRIARGEWHLDNKTKRVLLTSRCVCVHVHACACTCVRTRTCVRASCISIKLDRCASLGSQAKVPHLAWKLPHIPSQYWDVCRGCQYAHTPICMCVIGTCTPMT